MLLLVRVSLNIGLPSPGKMMLTLIFTLSCLKTTNFLPNRVRSSFSHISYTIAWLPEDKIRIFVELLDH